MYFKVFLQTSSLKKFQSTIQYIKKYLCRKCDSYYIAKGSFNFFAHDCTVFNLFKFSFSGDAESNTIDSIGNIICGLFYKGNLKFAYTTEIRCASDLSEALCQSQVIKVYQWSTNSFWPISCLGYFLCQTKTFLLNFYNSKLKLGTRDTFFKTKREEIMSLPFTFRFSGNINNIIYRGNIIILFVFI